MQENIILKTNKEDIPEDIIKVAKDDEIIAAILYNRDCKKVSDIKGILDDSNYLPTYPDEFPRMNEAIKIIKDAVDKKEKICIYGDYDVDGVTSVVILFDGIKKFNPNIIYHVPDRFSEGYGMNENVINKLADEGVKLIITCDCGVSNVQEILVAKKLGMKVIVTDHHTIPEVLPNADAILNAKFLEKTHRAYNISGAAMAYYLIKALYESYNMSECADSYLDLVALSTISDVVELRGENRYLVKKGIDGVLNPTRIGLKQLKMIIGNDNLNTEEDIAFQIAPRINAAGRIKTARLPVELLLTNDINEARNMAELINKLNDERKNIQNKIVYEAVQMVEKMLENKKILVLYRPYWHHGVTGIAAGKIAEKFNKPTILLSLKQDGFTVTGSARSIEGVSIYALIKKSSKHLMTFGGHDKAAGVSLNVNEIENFIQDIEAAANDIITEKDISNDIYVDAILDLKDANIELYNNIRFLAPYGEGFEVPTFYSKNVSVINDRVITNGHHLFVLEDNNIKISAVKWWGEDTDYTGKKVDIVYKLSLNIWKGRSSLQLTVNNIIVNQSYENMDNNVDNRETNLKFIDARNLTLNNLMLKYPQAEFYYEGVKKVNISTVSRNRVRNTNNFVLLSVPANTKVLKEIIYKADPENVIISYTFSEDYSINQFLKILLGVLKFVMRKYEGVTSLEQLSIVLGEDERVILAALKYLKSRGKILFEQYSSNKILIKKGNNVVSNDITNIQENLKNVANKKLSYYKFMKNVSCDEMKEYYKSYVLNF